MSGCCKGPKPEAGAKAEDSCCGSALDENIAREGVKEYYGKVLKSNADLKTNACCTREAPPSALVKAALANIHKEVSDRYYGCGLVVPELLQGCRVLDLGCGTGRDCYLLSQLVGAEGHVVGVDMTEEQLQVAKDHIDYHTKAFGYPQANVEFHQGYIEKLQDCGLADQSFDVIVSNCVVNLSPDKASVLSEAFRVLKKGGELYFSDVYADRRVPPPLAKHKVLYGECLSGAAYWRDFCAMARATGFRDIRLVKSSPFEINDAEAEALIGHIKFWSATFRLFKVDGLEEAQEDYGQTATYKGTLETTPETFVLDRDHHFPAHQAVPVSGNTSSLLQASRFSSLFDLVGDTATHTGPYGKENMFDLAGAKPSCC